MVFWTLGRHHVDGFIYIRYAVPPYSSRVSLATMQHTEFTEGSRKLQSYFNPFVDPNL